MTAIGRVELINAQCIIPMRSKGKINCGDLIKKTKRQELLKALNNCYIFISEYIPLRTYFPLQRLHQGSGCFPHHQRNSPKIPPQGGRELVSELAKGPVKLGKVRLEVQKLGLRQGQGLIQGLELT